MRRNSLDELVDELLEGATAEDENLGAGRPAGGVGGPATQVEPTDHLCYDMRREPLGGGGNTSNGLMPKTLMTEHGPVEGRTPWYRLRGFEPPIAKQRQRRFQGFDEEILALYSRALSTADLEAHVAEIGGVRARRALISRVADDAMHDIRARKQRPLETRHVAGGPPRNLC